jgi:predicted nicotinamide N-methyase
MNTDLPTVRPPMPETPRDALGEIHREEVFIEGRTFLMTRPEGADHLLDHPAVRAAFAADNYMPYWADLWPAARMLAKAILRQTWPVGLHALEIGCGLGLPGIAAMSQGVRVTFSDYDATALQFATTNARLNQLTNYDTLQMDWRYPPEGLRVPVVLASDLIYELRNLAPLVSLIRNVLTPDGVCLLTDQDRVPTTVIREHLDRAGLLYTTTMMRAGETGGRRYKGTLYRITLPGEGAKVI